MLTPNRAALGYDLSGCGTCRPTRYAACKLALRAGQETLCERDAANTPNRQRSTIASRAYEVIRSQQQCTASEIAAVIGHRRSATEKALKGLLASGKIVVAGKRKCARIYEVKA